MSRDTSADTTLDNANMGMREKFESWWVPWGDMHLDKLGMKRMALDSWQSRQPEIDALKAQVENYKEYADGVSIQLSQANKEIDALKAENERLRKDAERYLWLRDKETPMNGKHHLEHAATECDSRIDRAMKDFSTTKKEEWRGSEET